MKRHLALLAAIAFAAVPPLRWRKPPPMPRWFRKRAPFTIG